jgi:hypothetical protein
MKNQSKKCCATVYLKGDSKLESSSYPSVQKDNPGMQAPVFFSGLNISR